MHVRAHEKPINASNVQPSDIETMAVYLPMHKIIGNNTYVCSTPSTKKIEADFEPVVIIWHDEFSRHAAVVDVKNLPLKLHSSLSEEHPVIVVHGRERNVNLSSLQGEWSEGTFMEPLSERHWSQIAMFKSKLFEKGRKNNTLQLENPDFYKERSQKRRLYIQNNNTKWVIYFTREGEGCDEYKRHLYQTWYQLLWDYVYQKW